ncbi:MAG: SIR2 family protein [Bacteroidetes bacterium]|nr:SIR2 family protein [Bacteroidota bacterium]
MKSFKGQTALFLGNGINRTEENRGASWGALLKLISDSFRIKVDLTNDLKPFPLAFEEMLYSKPGSGENGEKLKQLKISISRILEAEASKLVDINVHCGFMESGIKEIITTNYDYNLENALTTDFMENKIKYSIDNSESKHSLYRGYKIGDINVRHVHGELYHNRKTNPSLPNFPQESIMIGFEHYSEYFERIQRIIIGESGRQKKSGKKSLLIRIRDNDELRYWMDLFFTHKLIIAGFSLDFSENHLWWLLLHRAELMRSKNKHDIEINNEIIYFSAVKKDHGLDFESDNKIPFIDRYKKKLAIQKTDAVTDVLRSLGVSVIPVPCSTYKEFYLQIINIVKHLK